MTSPYQWVTPPPSHVYSNTKVIYGFSVTPAQAAHAHQMYLANRAAAATQQAAVEWAGSGQSSALTYGVQVQQQQQQYAQQQALTQAQYVQVQAQQQYSQQQYQYHARAQQAAVAAQTQAQAHAHAHAAQGNVQRGFMGQWPHPGRRA